MRSISSISLMLAFLVIPGVYAGDATPVTVKTLSDLAFHPALSAPAEVVSLNDSQLSAQIQAVIKSIPVKVGQTVDRDSVLLVLDCRDYQLNLRQAEARLKAAKELTVFSAKQQQRAESLRNTSSISEELVLQRQTEFSRAQAEELIALSARERAGLDVSRCKIRAPFTGVVLERLASVGETVSPTIPLLRILDSAALEISAQVSLLDITDLRQAADLYFTFEGKTYPIKLRAITANINSRARNQDARFNFIEERALPGSPGRVEWSATVPHIAANRLVTRQESLGIFVVEQGHAKFIALPKALEGRPAALDLPLSTLVIVQGQRSVTDGSSVEVSP